MCRVRVAKASQVVRGVRFGGCAGTWREVECENPGASTCWEVKCAAKGTVRPTPHCLRGFRIPLSTAVQAPRSRQSVLQLYI